MPQAGRTANRSHVYTEDPIENVFTWLQLNAKPVLIGVGGVAIVVAAVLVYRASNESKREKASVALYAAQTPLGQGKFDEARTELQKVVQRYGGTNAGQQAALLLAQVLYEEGKYPDGIAVLERARGSASNEFRPSIDALIAAGHESAKNMEKAAEFYGKAADEALSTGDKDMYRASQARSLMVAGKLDAAKAIWTDMTKDETGTFAQEAKIRLGEIAGMQAGGAAK
jgi:predicted negative regulator of RcsB-dependent stress response